MAPGPTLHASAVVAGSRAVLIRGPSGAGKSRLARMLIAAAPCPAFRFARLVGDDRVSVEATHGRLLVCPAPALAGLIEVRGVGIERLPYEPIALVGLVVDLAVLDVPRLPTGAERTTIIDDVLLPRLAVAAATDPLPAVLAALTTTYGASQLIEK
jgi:HPr kinase/phosphorylase